MYNFVRALDRNADRWPEREAVAYYQRRLTNAELNQRVNALAAGLLDLGAERGSVLAVLLHNRPEFLEAIFAINKLGAIFLALNFRLAPAEWEYILEHSGATAIVTEADFTAGIAQIIDRLPKLQTVIVVGNSDPGRAYSYDSLLDQHSGEKVATTDVDINDVQRLMYTSGTTSRPKGVPLTYGNVLWKVFAHVVEFGITATDRTLMAGPMYHVGALDLPGIGVLYVGGSLVILGKFDAEELMRVIQAERPTNIWLAPAMVNAVLQLRELASYDASSVRLIVNGGEKMPVALIERVLKAFPKAWLADAYGLTETVSGDTFLDREHLISKIGSVGKPVLHLDVAIACEDGRKAGPDELGEIQLRGPKVFHGYWRDPEATAAAFSDGWFRTGDIGRIDRDGYLYIEDRKKDMIVSGGENIATPEVERVLYQHPAVFEVAVIGMADAKWGEAPKAFVVTKPGASVTGEELIVFCSQYLANFKVPKAIEFIDVLPRTPSGKVLKRALRQRTEPVA